MSSSVSCGVFEISPEEKSGASVGAQREVTRMRWKVERRDAVKRAFRGDWEVTHDAARSSVELRAHTGTGYGVETIK